MAAVAPRVEVSPLSPNVGAEIIGVDLSGPMHPVAFERILKAWHRHCVILFRDQTLSEDDQVRFAGRFGELGRVVNPNPGASASHPGVMFISNLRQDGKPIGALPDGEVIFHSDQCYVERPAAASMLYAIEVPAKGGNTRFANMYCAYDALPPDLKTRLRGARAMNVYDYDINPTHRGSSSAKHGVPCHAHPVFRTHPVTGRTALYVNRLMTEYIVGLAREESDRLLARLFDHAENPAWIYEHRWRPGDLLMWDNRCTLHARTDFDASERRLMRRCVVLGEIPA